MRLPGKILVVDDDPAMLRTVERLLAPTYDVRSVASGAEALAQVAKAPVDVAIVDVRMPGMDGFELTHRIRALHPPTEVILVTGSITDLDEKLIRAIEERAFYFITKPFSKAVLTSLVSWSLEMKRLEEERNVFIRRLTEDLERARRFQQSLLPRGLPRAFGPVRVASAWMPSQSVGGDLYDVLPLPGERLLLMVADVAGHGVAAALLVGMVKTAIGRCLQDCITEDQVELAPAARAVNETLAPLNRNRVVTLFLAVLDPRRRRLRYLNAGHPPAFVWSPGGTPRELPATTPLLSFGIDVRPTAEEEIPLEPGERLAIYSDGVYEILDPAGREFGYERFRGFMSAHAGPIEAAVDGIMAETNRHAGGRPPDDDLTLLVVEFQRR